MSEELDRDERRWAMLCHLSALSGYVIPMAHVLAPLLIWSWQRERFPLVDDQGRESLNYQLSMTIYMIVAALMCLVLIGIPILIGLCVFDCVIVIVAAVRANTGEAYRYPLTIRFF